MEDKQEAKSKQTQQYRSESPPPRSPRTLAHLNTVHARDQTPRAHMRVFNEDGSLTAEYVPTRNLGERINPGSVADEVAGGNEQSTKKADGQQGGVGDGKGNK